MNCLICGKQVGKDKRKRGQKREYCSHECLKQRKTKWCSKCKIIKPVSEWRKNIASIDGLQSWCYNCRIIQSQIYSKKNRLIINERTAKLRIKRRLELFIKLGKKCVKCGEIRVQLLQIDHVNNDGGKERKETKERGMSLTVMNQYLNGERDIKRLQLMCANCNFEKQYVSERLLKYIEDVKTDIGYNVEGGISG